MKSRMFMYMYLNIFIICNNTFICFIQMQNNNSRNISTTIGIYSQNSFFKGWNSLFLVPNAFISSAEKSGRHLIVPWFIPVPCT